MNSRTVRLDEETERLLEQLMRDTGLSISAIFKLGLLILRNQQAQEARGMAYKIYEKLDLGPGGYSTVPSTETRRGVKEAIGRKLGR